MAAMLSTVPYFRPSLLPCPAVPIRSRRMVQQGPISGYLRSSMPAQKTPPTLTLCPVRQPPEPRAQVMLRLGATCLGWVYQGCGTIPLRCGKERFVVLFPITGMPGSGWFVIPCVCVVALSQRH